MRKSLLVLMTAILISSTLLGPYEIAQGNDEVQSTSSDSWPMFRHDVQHTGFSTSTAPGDNKTIGGSIWNFSTGGEVHSSAAVVDGVVFIGSNDQKIYALNATTGAKIWHNSTGDLVRSSPAVVDDTVFIGSDDKQIYALNKTNGNIIWNYSTNGPIRSSPVVAGDLIIIGSGSPDNSVYALNKTGHLQWKQTLNGGVKSSPAVADGIVYVGSLGWNVYALNLTKNGDIITPPKATGGPISSSPTIALGLVFIGSDDGKLYALHEKTLDLNWSAQTGGAISSSPAFADGFVFVGSEDNSVYAFNATTGEQEWCKETGGMVRSSPAVADGKVFVGSNDDKLYALSQTTGDIMWTYQTEDAIESSPTIAEGKVFVGSKDKRVYAFGPNERPTARFSFKPEKPIENEAIEFDASNSSDPDYNDHIVKYEWDFGDNNETSTTSPKIIHKYAASGIYNVTLTVTDTHQATGSNFSYIEVLKHDVAVIDVEPLDTWVELGKIININITVENLGDFNEYSLNVTAYADMNEAPLQDEIRIGPTTITSLEPKEIRHVLISWNTSATEAQRGNYKISANVSQVKDEYEINNNMFRDEYIAVKIHDVAVTNVTTNKTAVQQGEIAYINVTVENQGDFAENVTITVYANDTNVTWGNLTQLAPGSNETKTLDWNTTGVAEGSYTLRALASIVPIDNDPSDDSKNCSDEIIVNPPGLNHDIAVSYVEPDYDSVFWSVSLYINVSVLNQGKADESNIAVFAYAVNTVTQELFGIGNKTITYLPSGSSKVLRFKWDTESTPKYEIATKYKIAANATLATDEDPSNNHNSAEVYIRPFIHDVAITKVTPLEGVTEPIIIGSPVHIDVTAENPGAFFEDISVVAYADLNATVIGDEYSIGPPIIISLPSLGSEIITFTWNTAGVAEGNYTISANATIVDDKVLSNNCKSSDLQVSLSEPWIRDINVTRIWPLKTILCKDKYNATILVTILNEGHFEETFSVTLNATGLMAGENYLIGKKNVTLPPNSTVTVAFQWNSSGVVKDLYTLIAKAGPVTNEIDTSDNIRIRTGIQITMEGDINGDGKVDIKDIAPIAAAFGAVHINDPASPKYCEYWHSSPCPNCPHSPNCDISCDGKIDIVDIALAAKNFGKTNP